MIDPVSHLAGPRLEAIGRALSGWVLQQNFWTALLVAGALLLDRALSLRSRASLRIALYAPVALRVLLPLDWNLALGGSQRVDAWFAPLFRVGALAEIADDPPSALSWYALAGVVYVLVALALTVRAMAALFRLRRDLREASPITGLEIDLPCPVVQHDHLGPMVTGLLAPRIVVPRDLMTPEHEQALGCVLRHEIAHLGRRDVWLSAAMLMVGIAGWPIVPVRIAIARVRQLIELACDEKALDGADVAERRRYGHTLLDIAESRSFAVASVGVGGLYFGSTLRARVEALGAQRHWPFAAQASAISFLPVALLLACGGVTLPPGYGYEFAPQVAKSASTASIAAPLVATGPEGRLVPEAIEGIVLVHLGAISSCYEAGRQKSGAIAGQVNVRFVIGEDGATRSAIDEGSTLSDRIVVDCIVGVFRELRYPVSRGGNVTVVYPIQLGS